MPASPLGQPKIQESDHFAPVAPEDIRQVTLERPDGTPVIGRTFNAVPVAKTNASGRTAMGTANTVPSSFPPAPSSRQAQGTMIGISSAKPIAQPRLPALPIGQAKRTMLGIAPTQPRQPAPSTVFTSVNATMLRGITDSNSGPVTHLNECDLIEDVASERTSVNKSKPRPRVDMHVVRTTHEKPPAPTRAAQPASPKLRPAPPTAEENKSDAIGREITATAKKTIPPRSVTPQPFHHTSCDEAPTTVFELDDNNPTRVFDTTEEPETTIFEVAPPTLPEPMIVSPPAIAQKQTVLQPPTPRAPGSTSGQPAFPKPSPLPVITSGSAPPVRPKTIPPMSSIAELEEQKKKEELELLQTQEINAYSEILGVDLSTLQPEEFKDAQIKFLEAKCKETDPLKRRNIDLLIRIVRERATQATRQNSVASKLPRTTEGSRASTLPRAESPRTSHPPPAQVVPATKAKSSVGPWLLWSANFIVCYLAYTAMKQASCNTGRAILAAVIFGATLTIVTTIVYSLMRTIAIKASFLYFASSILIMLAINAGTYLASPKKVLQTSSMEQPAVQNISTATIPGRGISSTKNTNQNF